MALRSGNELLAAIHHKDTRDEKSTSTILLNSLRFKQTQERDELEKLFLKDRINCKNDELGQDVSNVSRNDVCLGSSPPFGQKVDTIKNLQRCEALQTFPISSHQPNVNFQFPPSFISNYYQHLPQFCLNNYQQAMQFQLSFNADLSHLNGFRDLSNQRHTADKQFYNG